MFEGIKKVFSGTNAFERQIAFFSVCGIAGLVNGYFAIYAQDIGDLPINFKFAFTVLLIMFTLFFTGYEIIFMKERELPEIDMRSVEIVFKKLPFFVFAAGLPILLAGLYTKHNFGIFLAEAFLIVPLTMMQAGFSYNYKNSDFGMLFQKFSIKDYVVLLIKWIFVIGSCYLIALGVVFIIFLIGGIFLVISYKADVSAITMFLSANQIAVAKLSAYLTGVLLTYNLSVGTLIWNYELIQTYEKK